MKRRKTFSESRSVLLSIEVLFLVSMLSIKSDRKKIKEFLEYLESSVRNDRLNGQRGWYERRTWKSVSLVSVLFDRSAYSSGADMQISSDALKSSSFPQLGSGMHLPRQSLIARQLRGFSFGS